MKKIPKKLLPLPPLPEGYDYWEYKGTTFHSSCLVVYAIRGYAANWHDPREGFAYGGPNFHYIVAKKNPSPMEQLKNPTNVRDGLRVYDHPEGKMVLASLHNTVSDAKEKTIAGLWAMIDGKDRSIRERDDKIIELHQKLDDLSEQLDDETDRAEGLLKAKNELQARLRSITLMFKQIINA